MTYGMAMVPLRHDVLASGLATFLLVLMCYLAGRVHQFFKQTNEREQAFRDGYNQATKSLFSLATRSAKNPDSPVRISSKQAMRGYATVPDKARSPLPARHRAEGRRKPNLADTLITDAPNAA